MSEYGFSDVDSRILDRAVAELKQELKKEYSDDITVDFIREKVLPTVAVKMTPQQAFAIAEQEISHCNKCGACCVNSKISIGQNETSAMAAAMGMKESRYRAKYLKRKEGEVGVLVFKNGTCPHFKDNQCEIYEARPMVCRAFPFTPDEDGKITVQPISTCEYSMYLATTLIKSMVLKYLTSSLEDYDAGRKRNYVDSV